MKFSIHDAINTAVLFHMGQVDKDGLPYIYHPIFVMNSMPLGDKIGRIVGILHDVVEDTDCDLEHLESIGCSDEAIEAIDAISERESESYDEYLERCKSNPIALRVKIKDVDHNYARSKKDLEDSVGDQVRLKRAGKRISKYERALEILKGEA